MSEPGSDVARSVFIAGLRRGQVLTAVVADVDDREVLLDLPGPGGIYRQSGEAANGSYFWVVDQVIVPESGVGHDRCDPRAGPSRDPLGGMTVCRVYAARTA